MDQNRKNKVNDFFRKEGFYLILFLCLCVIATVAVVTTKNTKISEQSNGGKSEFTLNADEKERSEIQKQNADRVENSNIQENDLAQESQEVASNEEDVDVSIGTNVEVKFSNPLDGLIAREYTYPKPQNIGNGVSRNIRGIDIKASVGTEVKAAAVGEVKEISNKSEEGNYVVIAHANGLYTKYCNLSKDISVNIGDKVTEETVIGTVGDSSIIFKNNEFGEHLNIQVQDSDGKDLDPTTYFTFSEE